MDPCPTNPPATNTDMSGTGPGDSPQATPEPYVDPAHPETDTPPVTDKTSTASQQDMAAAEEQEEHNPVSQPPSRSRSRSNPLTHTLSVASVASVASTIEEEIANTLQATETRQEKLVQDEVTPFHLEFWKPRNIMSVEDTPFSNRYLVTLMVISFSVPGNLARIALQGLTRYDNSYINYSGGTVVWVNFASCFVMSWCNNSVGFWSHILAGTGKTNMKQLALHTGITSGFCGSFSTFSSALIEIFFKTIDIVQRPLPNVGYRVTEFFASSLVTFSLPFFGHILGRQFAMAFDLYIVPRFSRFLTYRNARAFELFCTLVGIGALISDLVLTCALSVGYWYKESYSFGILMGAFGALLRFKLSSLNGRFFAPWFPTGTLMANVIGCLLIAILNLLIYGYRNAAADILLVSSPVHRFILTGFSLGFCGSLTTMSSFINELYNLDHPWLQHIYFWATFTPCFIVILLIDGSYAWSRGFQHV